MTYNEFVDKYCDGMEPTMMQKWAIKAYLDDPGSQQVWLGGRGGGKTTLVGWLQKAHHDKLVESGGQHLNSNPHIDTSDYSGGEI